MSKTFAGITVSLGILVAAVFSVFYAALIPIAMDVMFAHLKIPVGDYDFLIVLIFANVGTYTFTSAIPSHILRKKNFFIQSLAHILASSVAVYVQSLTLNYEDKRPPLPMLAWFEHPLLAGLHVSVPFIILAYVGIRSKRESTRPKN